MLNLFLADIGSTWFLPFENSFILWLQSLGGEGSFIYYFMQFVTLFGEEMIAVAIMGLVYWGLDKKRGERIGIMMLTATLLNPMIKNIVRRTRPFDSGVSGIKNLKDVEGYSFPSGHSSAAASVFVGTAVTYRDKRQKWLLALAIVLPLLVALSRNYLGAHYLSDVVAGLALGVGVVFLLNWLLDIVPNKYFVYIGILVIGLAGMFYCTTEDYFTGYGLACGFVAGVFFEEKVVNFQNTRVWWQVLLRLACGGAIYLVLNTLIKLPFNNLIFDAEGMIKTDMVWFERIFRVVRYAIIVFVCVGVYPMLFKYMDRLGLRKNKE
jgi:membrane-associated phospholipid phosphatase